MSTLAPVSLCKLASYSQITMSLARSILCRQTASLLLRRQRRALSTETDLEIHTWGRLVPWATLLHSDQTLDVLVRHQERPYQVQRAILTHTALRPLSTNDRECRGPCR